MDEQVFSYQGTYPVNGNFTSHYLWQSKVIFSEEPPEPSPEPSIIPSPSVRHEQQRRRLFDRILQQLKAADLPGKEHAIDYLTHKFRRNLKGSTLASSDTAIRFFLTFLKAAGKDRLADISRSDIETFVELLQDKGLQIRSVRNRLVALYSFLKFLVDNDLIDAVILSKKIRLKQPDALPRAIDSIDVKQLFFVIDHPRDLAMFLLLLRTGMRIGELLDLQVTDVDLQEQKVLIYVGEKNHRGRVVYFSNDARDALAGWLAVRDPSKGCLFYSARGHSLSYPAARIRFNKYVEKAGLSDKGYTLHQLRHTFATELLNAGMRLECLQPLLGHSTLEMTRRYARLSDKSRETEYFRAMAKIERGITDGDKRIDNQLQTVFEEKELFAQHS